MKQRSAWRNCASRLVHSQEKSITFLSTQKNLLSFLSDTKVLNLTERRTPIGRDEAQQLLSLKVRRGGPEVLRKLQETVSNLLGVQIDAFEGSGRLHSEGAAEMDVDNFIVEANGSGIREALRLILDVEFQHPEILLVEEPEIHLHPALETTIMRYLKSISSDCQVFITTHSTNFLDTSDMRNVYLVSKPESTTNVQLLDLQEAEAQIPKELGLRLSSLFMFDRLLFVEGPSDEAAVREWSSTLGISLSQANLGFIHMGGVHNFGHFASEEVLSLLSKRQVKMWFLVDRDERDEAEVEKLQKLLGENAELMVLTKRELENYMLAPRALVEFITLKRRLANSKAANGADLPTEEELMAAMRECAEELRNLAITKRVVRRLCRPVYPGRNIQAEAEGGSDAIQAELQRMLTEMQSMRDSASQAYEDIAQQVNENWEADKLSLAPGHELLDLTVQRFGVRYKKDVDAGRLASLMNENEIDDELARLIRQLGAA